MIKMSIQDVIEAACVFPVFGNFAESVVRPWIRVGNRNSHELIYLFFLDAKAFTFYLQFSTFLA